MGELVKYEEDDARSRATEVPRAVVASIVTKFDVGIIVCIFVTMSIWDNSEESPGLYVGAVLCGVLTGLRGLYFSHLREPWLDSARAALPGGHSNGDERETPDERLAKHQTAYRVSLAMGLIALSIFVLLSGGIVKSPFNQLLIASFVLAQILAPKTKTVIHLALLGIATILIIWALHRYVLLEYFEDWALGEVDILLDGEPATRPTLRFDDHLYIVPGFLAAFAATVVNYVTVEARANAVPT